MHGSFYTWDGAVLGRANLLLFESSVLNLSKFQVPTNELTHCVLTNGHWICLILFYRSLFCKLIIQLLKNWNTNSIVYYYWTSSIQKENYVIETITRTVIKAERGREKLEHVKNHCFDDRNNSISWGLGLFWKSWNSFFFLFFSFLCILELKLKTKKIDHCRLTLQDRPSLCFFPLLFPFGVLSYSMSPIRRL